MTKAITAILTIPEDELTDLEPPAWTPRQIADALLEIDREDLEDTLKYVLHSLGWNAVYED